MKFALDENLPVELVDILQDAGHEAVTVVGQDMGGQSDQKIIDLCQKEKRALVTLDLDFSDIRHYPPSDYAGIVILKSFKQSKGNILELARKFVPLLEKEPLKCRLWIVEENRIRIRE